LPRHALHDAITRFLADQRIGDERILVAVSGGADSTALLLALHEIGRDLVAGHVNHHLRGSESDADEQFVRELCATRGIALFVADGSLPPELVRRVGVEAAARHVRYARLHELRAQAAATYIATAHQQNDQAETVLMRRRTGGGLAAQRGILPRREDGVIRPLLAVKRLAVDSFLGDRGITPRVDASNADRRFVRNAIRKTLDADDIARLAAEAADAQARWNEQQRRVDAVDDAHATATATLFRTLPDDEDLRRALLVRHIRRLDPDARNYTRRRIAQLAATCAPRVRVTKHLELLHQRGATILRRIHRRARPFEATLTPNVPLRIDAIGATITLKTIADAGIGTRERQRFQLPLDGDATFVVRNRRPGDRFQPLGMTRDKKLKDFLIDRKIAAESRDHIPLILWNGAIIVVAGVEVSEGVRITAAAGERYEVTVEHEHDEDVQR
jgi:tRNA(Ile)-lysidine synthase